MLCTSPWTTYRSCTLAAWQVRAEKPKWYLAVIAGAVLRTLGHVAVRSAEYLGYLQKGQLPPARISLTSFTEEVVLDGVFSDRLGSQSLLSRFAVWVSLCKSVRWYTGGA